MAMTMTITKHHVPRISILNVFIGKRRSKFSSSSSFFKIFSVWISVSVNCFSVFVSFLLHKLLPFPMFVVSEQLLAAVAVIVGALCFVVAGAAGADAAVKRDVMMIASDDSVVDVAFSRMCNFVLRLTWFWVCLPDYNFVCAYFEIIIIIFRLSMKAHQIIFDYILLLLNSFHSDVLFFTTLKLNTNHG